MAEVIFWGKPGCAGNTRQVALLRASGHEVQWRDLSTAGWTTEALRPFFGASPVAEWFNRGAPKVKHGEIIPEQFSEAEALALFAREPLLIRRPLMMSGEARAFGFDQANIAAWLGLRAEGPAVGEGCPRPDMPPCPSPDRTAHD